MHLSLGLVLTTIVLSNVTTFTVTGCCVGNYTNAWHHGKFMDFFIKAMCVCVATLLTDAPAVLLLYC